MAYREKAAWVSLVLTVVIWGPYFLLVAGEIDGGSPDGALILGRFTSAVVASVVLSIITSIILALIDRRAEAPADEREALFDHRATGVAYVTLSVGVVFVALATPLVAAASPFMFDRGGPDEVALVAANGALSAFLIAEVVRNVVQIAQHRRGR